MWSGLRVERKFAAQLPLLQKSRVSALPGRTLSVWEQGMTIEISRGKSEHIFRLNPYNPRLIDRRKNVAYARWKRYGEPYATQTEALAALLKLEKGKGEGE